MFEVGQKVICIDDKFEPWVYDLYRSLPKKDDTYTVRAIQPGRSNPKFEVNDEAEIKMKDAQYDILILLNELRNPDDPHSTVKQELGFRAERFAEAQEQEEGAEAYDWIGKSKAQKELVPA